MMSKINQTDIDRLIELVGGRGNIATVSHCITRLRFVLNQPANARPKEIEQLPMVKGCFTNAGQFQVVIGTNVGDYYQALIASTGQAQVDKDSETGKFIIGRGMTADEVRAKTEKALDSLPGVAGVNNHRGSRATESRELMAPFMQVLKSRGLFFVDSRTTGKSVAYDAARKAGVPALQNRGFLDNSTDKAEIAKRFDELVRNAQKRGALLIICHFRPATVAFLEELNARYKNLPVRFVTVPEMLALTDNGVPKKK